MLGARRLSRSAISGGQPIAIHEFLYPLVQGYDSVALKADVGTRRHGPGNSTCWSAAQLQKQLRPGAAGACLTMPLLEGLDGVNKMSKSLGNYVGIAEHPDEMFGKLMSISDELMWRYYELLSFLPVADVAQLKRAVADGRNPRDVKFELGIEIGDRFHGSGRGVRARDEFIARFPAGRTAGFNGRSHPARRRRPPGTGPGAERRRARFKHERRNSPDPPGAVKVDGERVEDIAMSSRSARLALSRWASAALRGSASQRECYRFLTAVGCLLERGASGCRSASPAAAGTRGCRSRGSCLPDLSGTSRACG